MSWWPNSQQGGQSQPGGAGAEDLGPSWFQQLQLRHPQLPPAAEQQQEEVGLQEVRGSESGGCGEANVWPHLIVQTGQQRQIVSLASEIPSWYFS